MDIQILNPASLYRPRGYSHGAKVTGAKSLIFIAGETSYVTADRVEGRGDIVRQMDKALENLLVVLRDAGAGPENIAAMTWYVTSIAEYQMHLAEMGPVYQKHMGKRFPSIAIVEVPRLWHPDLLIEIAATAAV